MDLTFFKPALKYNASLTILSVVILYLLQPMFESIEFISNNPKIAIIDEYTYYYFYNANSVSNIYKKNLYENYHSFLKLYLEYLNKRGRFRENKDLVALRPFSSIDSVTRECYIYSKSKYKDIKKEIIKFKNHDETNRIMKELTRGGYVKYIPRRFFKYYIWLFTKLFNFNLICLATLLQMFRFKITKVEKYKN